MKKRCLMTLLEYIKEIFQSTKAELDPIFVEDLREIVINGISYLVKSIYRTDTKVTAIDKIERLIDKDANCS